MTLIMSFVIGDHYWSSHWFSNKQHYLSLSFVNTLWHTFVCIRHLNVLHVFTQDVLKVHTTLNVLQHVMISWKCEFEMYVTLHVKFVCLQLYTSFIRSESFDHLPMIPGTWQSNLRNFGSHDKGLAMFEFYYCTYTSFCLRLPWQGGTNTFVRVLILEKLVKITDQGRSAQFTPVCDVILWW